MAKVRTIELADGTQGWMIFCPGCNHHHIMDARWSFNENINSPTFSPSLLVKSGHYASYHQGDRCWCTFNAERKHETPDFECIICHSFITDGKIRYLEDTTHKFSGQTIDLPDM